MVDVPELVAVLRGYPAALADHEVLDEELYTGIYDVDFNDRDGRKREDDARELLRQHKAAVSYFRECLTELAKLTGRVVVLESPFPRVGGPADQFNAELDDVLKCWNKPTQPTTTSAVVIVDNTKPPAELMHELTKQQSAILAYLWNAKHATKWHSLPDCWRDGSTNDQEDRTIESALERLRDRLNALPNFGLTLEVHSAIQTTKLLHNPPRK